MELITQNSHVLKYIYLYSHVEAKTSIIPQLDTPWLAI